MAFSVAQAMSQCPSLWTSRRTHAESPKPLFAAQGVRLCRTFPSSYGRSSSTRLLVRAQVEEKEVQTKAKEQTLIDKLSRTLTGLLSSSSISGMPVAEGQVSDLVNRPFFDVLYEWFLKHGGVYKLGFGPKAFVIVSDPICARHILKENSLAYDKGILAEILEPIMGKGLIPADMETWKVRRRAIVPGFHAAYLEAMVSMFGSSTERTVQKLSALVAQSASGKARVEMESEYSSLALDIIGIGVFNYDFGSVNNESPIIKAVYGTLAEAEHRATFYFPYWNIPFVSYFVPRQIKFQADLKVINECLDELIRLARETRQEDDMEALMARDYSKVKDRSLLRFLVDMRGEDCNNRQLRDDLMTMLIAGHETTAAVLTWATFELAQHPEVVAKAQEEVDRVLGDRTPTLEDIKELQYIRLIVAEALRLYPQPPVLIRRALEADTIPGGHLGRPEGYRIPQGTDIFVSPYNIHRSPYFWDRPTEFCPERFLEAKASTIPGWEGYDPSKTPNALYPNETMFDFAFLPFGGGLRKCVGDQFALMESVVGLAMILRRFEISLDGLPKDVEMVTGATMHTKNGLWCNIRPRTNIPVDAGKVVGKALVSS